MDLPSWLHHIEHCSPREMDLGLSRMQQMMSLMRLQKSQLGYVITVAGTNGKGSTVALLEACLLFAGCKVGVYTSPHLSSVTERVRVQQQNIDESGLILALEAVEAHRENLPLTYFEFMTLAALWHFQQLSLDVVILEVGLGGRLDAVNAVDADAAIITSIDLDHQHYLGDTVEQIAVEKAGVMRAQQPVVYGGANAIQVIQQQAQRTGAYCYSRPTFSYNQHIDGINTHYQYPREPSTERPTASNHDSRKQWQWNGVDANGQQLQWQQLPLPSILLDNAACCLQAMQLLPPRLRPNREQIEQGLCAVQVAGRLQWVSPSIMVDVAHNPAAITQVLAHLIDKDLANWQRVLAVFGVMADKDWLTMVELLRPAITAWLPVQANDARALPRQELINHLHNQGCEVLVPSLDISQLVTNSRQWMKEGDLVLVLGSFAVVGPFLQQFYAGNLNHPRHNA